MAALFKKLFGDSNEKELRNLNRKVDAVNELEDWAVGLPDEQFPRETALLKERLAGGETLDDILPHAFALAREAARRKTGMRPFDVQIQGGTVLHQGRIAEMKTGEGKTLVATLPAYLNALSGKGVHVVTVNDYLARRDRFWMGPIFEMLGLSVGLVVQGLSQEQRRAAYRCDILYATNNELGFDYLRDNMVIYEKDLAQREKHYAIVDEVDSILIDEARTPLIISGRVESQEDFGRWKREVEQLIRRQGRFVGDLIASARKALEAGRREEAAEFLLLVRRGDPKNKTLLKMLKEPGVEKLVERTKQILSTEKRLNHLDEELFFTIDEATRLADIKDKGYRELEKLNPELVKLLSIGRDGADMDALDEEQEAEEAERAAEHRHCFDQLIRAYALYENDVDYVIQDGKVVIVDIFTGRLMHGRRYSDGLHQAIEAKEGVQIQAATRTVASVTFQNYFRMYDKVAGMTGTAKTEEKELRDIYGMDVVEIETNKPLIRQEWPDLVYKTERAKFEAVIDEIAHLKGRGQPVLVGTVSVEKSEMLSKMLKRRGIEHEVLNAVNHSREAYIIAQAGRRGAVTISTNMAGRGTDIILGGNPEYLAREKLENEFDGVVVGELEGEKRSQWEARLKELLQGTKEEARLQREDVLASGGLHVLGTERHESRRIDNQLRGRSGRQGDPGSSQFFVSLEDDLMRLFGGENIANLMDRFGIEESVPIDHPLVSRAIEGAQKKVESRNFEIRRNLINYDDVLNEQRKVIYSQRRRVLEGDDMKEPVLDMVAESVERLVAKHSAEMGFLDDRSAGALLEEAAISFLRSGSVAVEAIRDCEKDEVIETLLAEARSFYEERETELGPGIMRELERVVLLKTVDRHWMHFIDAMHELRRDVQTQAMGQRDPLIAYRRESFDMFEDMIGQVQEDIVRAVYRARVTAAPQRQAVSGEAVSHKPAIIPVGGGAPASAGGQARRQGAQPKKRQPVKVEKKAGRNDPCPCGSGKKFKKCCGG